MLELPSGPVNGTSAAPRPISICPLVQANISHLFSLVEPTSKEVMDFRDFHDGYFDGIHIESDKAATIFLRSAKKRPHILLLEGVERLSIADVKEGNIIFDLVPRSAREATLEDVQRLYDVYKDEDMAVRLLNDLRGRQKELQILELNSSYGAEGLFLFENAEIKESDAP